jgi:hypothetical protein
MVLVFKGQNALIILSFFLLLAMLFGFQKGNLYYALDSYNYKYLIGHDENYWIEMGECYVNNSEPLLFCLQLEPAVVWPLIIASSLTLGMGSIFYLVVVKWLIYVTCTHFLLKTLSRITSSTSVLIYGVYLYLNPYITLLHISMLRDTLILSAVLAFMAFLVIATHPWYFDKPRSKTLSYIIIVIIFALSLRPLIAIAMVITIVLFFLFSMNTRRHNIIYIGGISCAILYYFVNFAPAYSYSLNLSALGIGFVRLIYSPMPWNILDGSVQKAGADTALVWWWSLIVWFFAVAATFYLQVRILMAFIGRSLLDMPWPFMCLAMLILLPYAFSDLQVQGPRQSMPATALIFYAIGVPFIRTLLVLSRGPVAYKTKRLAV